MKRGIILTVLCAVSSTAMAAGQASAGAPKLDALVDGVSVVSGVAAPGSAPIVIYDTSTQMRTKMGTATVTAPNGKFYCALKPPLAAGHKMIAIDKNGNTSAVVTVLPKGPNSGRVPQ